MNKLARALLVTLVAFALLEVGARLVPARWTEPGSSANGAQATAMLPDPHRIFRFPPGAVRLADTPALVDSDGLRVSAVQGPADAPLIFTLGDSSLFGHGVRDGDTLHDQLQAKLTRAGKPVRVRCGGSPGYSTVQALAVLDEVGWPSKPSLLVVAPMWSDSRLDRYRDAEVIARGSILDYSTFFKLLRWGVRTAGGQPTTWKVAWPTPSDAGVRRVPLAAYRQNLDTILTQARAHNAGVVMLGLPHASWVAEGNTHSGSSSLYIDALRSVAEARHVPYVDGTDTFVRLGADRTLFIDRLHPTGVGQGLLAQAIADVLLTSDWPSNALIPDSGTTDTPLPADPYDGTTAAPADSMRRSMNPGFMEPEGKKRGLPAPPVTAGTR
jgi:lysophospholipase L1-like esterase